MNSPDLPFTDNTPMPFGRYHGKAMIQVPAKYLLWLFDQVCSHEGVKRYIESNLDALRKEAGLVKR